MCQAVSISSLSDLTGHAQFDDRPVITRVRACGVVSQASPMFWPRPGMIKFSMLPKNMSLHATTLPPNSTAARSMTASGFVGRPIRGDDTQNFESGDAAVGKDIESQVGPGLVSLAMAKRFCEPGLSGERGKISTQLASLSSLVAC